MKTILLAAALAALGTPALAEELALTGSAATAAVYCCTSPDELSRISTVATVTVGDGIEFPNGSLLPLSSFYRLIPVDVDIGATTIALQYFTNQVAGPGAFNGHVIRFEGAPMIVGVSINPASTYAPTAVTFLADAIMINAANVQFTPDSRLVLDVALAVPEPGSTAMLLGGLAVLAHRRWRRRDERPR